MEEITVKNFHCNDGFLVAIIGEMKSNRKWVLYSMSKVLGEGMAEYNNQIIDTYYDEVIGLNSYSGLSYIATKLNDKWGLIEIRDNGKVECKWKVIADNEYDDFDDMIFKFGITKEEYIEV